MLAGTSLVYKTDEPCNMQWQKQDSLTRSFTPRIEDGGFSNVYDKDATVSVKGGKRRVKITVCGNLTDENGMKGAPFRIRYRFSGNKLRIAVTGKGRFVLPVIGTPSGKGSGISVHASSALSVEKTGRPDGYAFTPIAGLMGQYYTVPLNGRETRITLKYCF